MERLISTPAASPSQTRIRLPGGSPLLPSRRLPAVAWPRLRLRPARPGAAIALASPLRHEGLSAAAPEEARGDEPAAAFGPLWKLLGSLLPKVIGFFPPPFSFPWLQYLAQRVERCQDRGYVSDGGWCN